VTVEVQLLGRFEVRRDGVVVPPFPRRSAASLVKLLALAPGHRISCERAVDALWPDLLLDEARPRLHKAAHYARRTLDLPDAVALQDSWVALLPREGVEVDLERFEAAASAALAAPDAGRPAECAAAAALCTGELLPQDEYEPWTQEPRARVRLRRLALLRAAGRWADVLDLDPADEEAHLAGLREAVAARDRAEALRRYERMEQALIGGPGTAPGPEAAALRDRALALPSATLPRPATPSAAPPARGPRPVLLERDTELTRLEAAVDTAIADRRGSVVLVHGEAGSGKTTLLAELVHRVGDRLAVLEAGCDDLLAPRSLGPFRDLAPTVDGELADALAAGGDPEAVFPALLRLLGGGPVLLAIEDVHWADDATVDAIRYVARRIAVLPAVLLLTCREDELGRTHPLRKVFGTLPGTSLLRVPVRPLTRPAVAALAGRRTDPERLYRVTRGNPFFVTEVLAAGGSGVPATVRDAVLARLAGVSADARDLVQRLAVVPSRADRRLAEHLAGGRPDPLVEAERAGVMAGDASNVWFRHEIARVAVLSTLTPGELVAAHRRVLDALLREPAPDPARVVHHAQAGRRTDVLLEHGPVAAADAVRAGAYRQAAETLRVVIDAGSGLPPARLARLLADRSACLYYLNLFEESFGAATQAVALAEEASDPLLLADALSVLSKAAFWARGPLSARAAATRAVQLLQGSGDDARRAAALAMLARSHSNLGTLGIVAEPGSECTRYAEQALTLAEQVGDNEVRCQALFYVGSGRLADGDERGLDDLERSVRLGDGDPHLDLEVRACVNAAGSAHRAGRFTDAERYIEHGLRYAEQSEFFGGDYRLRLTRASLRASEGSWDEAIAELRSLLAAPGDPAAMGLMARALLARLLGRRGDPDAEAVLAGAVLPPDTRGEVFVEGPLVAAAVELAWLRGDTEEMPGLAADLLRSASEVGHRGSRSELYRYLQRAGHPVDPPPDAIGPWVAGLAGRPLESAAAWATLGERYEEAVERVLSGVDEERGRGLLALEGLGATATLMAVRRLLAQRSDQSPAVR
jgi:DNA-binding SARP family transcriptional activator